jgi:cobalt/nickel transport system permease protein
MSGVRWTPATRCPTLTASPERVAERSNFARVSVRVGGTLLKPVPHGKRDEHMHIPDGYLSPSTCAALYAAAVPFWYTASRRVTRLLSTRLVPRLALFSAFSFIVMMFNIPLPGGTTGHAVGVGIAAVTLGPWASMLAVSIALLIQALFFGDGGVLAFGANSFNLAVVGSLVASWTYRLAAGNSSAGSSRRVAAAAIAGYVAINVAALVTAVELGIQPMLFTDASGAPLYAPYPLHIAIPAMMIGHVTVAGFAEAIVCAGVVAYLQRSDPDFISVAATQSSAGTGLTWRLWAGLAFLLILSPLGLLATGTAWGEWGSEDFSDPDARAEIAMVSGGSVPPAPPVGLERWSSFWTAPIPDYAPAFLRSPELGYILSGMVGTGLIILVCLGAGWLARAVRGPKSE